jgi:hypothetical protein
VLAISMMQPYAWLFAQGYLTIDDRTRPTAVRGTVAIHASRRFHAAYDSFIRSATDWPLPPAHELEHGGLVGMADLVDCIPAVTVAREPDIRRVHFGAPGFYGLEFANARPLAFVPLAGRLGIFQVPDSR